MFKLIAVSGCQRPRMSWRASRSVTCTSSLLATVKGDPVKLRPRGDADVVTPSGANVSFVDRLDEAVKQEERTTLQQNATRAQPAKNREDAMRGISAVLAALLLIGTVGVLTRRNIVIILMSIELILNAVNINLIAFSHALQNISGQIFAIFVITDAVAEAAVGLGILIALFRNKETVLADEIDLLKW